MTHTEKFFKCMESQTKCFNLVSQGVEVAAVPDGEFFDSFDVTNGMKNGYVMAPVALFFSVILKYTFGDIDTGVKF